MSVSAAEPWSPTRQGEDCLLQKQAGRHNHIHKERKRESVKEREGGRERERGWEKQMGKTGRSLVNEILQVRIPHYHPSLSSFIYSLASFFCALLAIMLQIASSNFFVCVQSNYHVFRMCHSKPRERASVCVCWVYTSISQPICVNLSGCVYCSGSVEGACSLWIRVAQTYTHTQ